MRFRLLETKNIDLIARVDKLTDEAIPLKDKQDLAIELMTKLNIRNCPITYLVQDVNDNKHPVFELVQQLFYNHSNNPSVHEVFKKLKIPKGSKVKKTSKIKIFKQKSRKHKRFCLL